MGRISIRLFLADAISLSRLIAALIFASIALHKFSAILVATIYACAAVSDFIDGYVARKLKAATFAGNIIDLISDKSLTVVSLLYATVRGVDILPLALIGVREIIVLGARIIIVDGRQLLPTSQIFGGIMAAILWGNTLMLILSDQNDSDLIKAINIVFWICAAIFTINLIVRLITSRSRIKQALELDR